MPENTTETVDIIVVGSGAGALTAALTAAINGASVVVLEKAARFGGTSASSGGGLWIPLNHLMLAGGVDDNREDALRYLRALTDGDVDPAVVEAFVDQGPRMLRFLEDNSHVRYEAMLHYADYYQEIPGARPGGRSIDPLPWDARELGEVFLEMQPSHVQTTVMGLMGYTNLEGAVLLSKAPGWLKVVAKLALDYVSDIGWRLRSKRSRRLTMGNALMARLRRSLLDRGVPLRLSTPVRELIRDGERVTGVIAENGGQQFRLMARKGVIVGTGGFEHSQAMRERYLPAPTQCNWSAASPTNTGDLHLAAERIGAALHLMDEAWWGPTIVMEGEDRARMLFTERSMPGCIMVNRTARRFFNESVAYTTAVQAMYTADDGGTQNLPAWAIFDARYRRNYPFGPLLPGGMHLDWLQPSRVRNRFLQSAPTLQALAAKLGLDGQALAATVARFNGFAQSGTDEDFHRGENSYDLMYGDVRLGPNPCLASIAEAPFYAVQVHPGDIGTKGGILTNADASALDTEGKVIPGLYAIGNCSASSMGRYYPGAGATLGPAMTFGFVAANHACGAVAG
jgi:3-oxosteroid 1-dehydrogenase